MFLKLSVYVSVLELVLGVDERLQQYCDPSSKVTSVDFDLRCTCKIVDVPFIGILSQMYPLECHGKDGPTKQGVESDLNPLILKGVHLNYQGYI